MSIRPLTASWRKWNYKKGQPYLKDLLLSLPGRNKLNINGSKPDNNICGGEMFDVFISYHPHDKNYADFLKCELQTLSPSISISTIGSPEKDRLSVLDESRIVVPLLSSMYTSDASCLEELNSSLSKHRWSDRITCCPVIIDSLPLSPVYPSLCFCLFSCTDSFWLEKYFEDPIESSLVSPIPGTCLRELAKFLVKATKTGKSSKGSLKAILNVNELEKSIDQLKMTIDTIGEVPGGNPLYYLHDLTVDVKEFPR